MLTLKRQSLNLLIAAGLLPALLLAGCTTTYKYGLEVDDYPEYFPNWKAGYAFNGNYSWHSDFRVDDSVITVEHGVIASSSDIERLSVANGNYLFFSIEFNGQNVVSVAAELADEETELELVGEYVFESRFVDDRCTRDMENRLWVVTPISNGLVNRHCDFGYVALFEVPKPSFISWLVPKKFWLKKELNQSIRIETTDRYYEFDHIVEWHQSSALWYEILLIT
ncbi:hypothetical protein BGP77_07385 [Saccharospirillum sp. MSK14-1]|uniref:hypothetical protein n=1 Tax=Saccharospirillum sp. MSK14-1 TaxID=1897632 RepID=UPI000D3ACF0D|nr:hypothetical protein [Saccharospirillum sp. MSK14-1]PTY37095.1 hypothetical protein BGP77_07385 [Saccharospirillum sp. MSK14-1]